jgi:hypothetical protein
VSRPVALLLPSLDAIDALAPEQLAPMLAHLAALQARIAARLAAVPAQPPPAEDDLLDIDQVAALTRRSKSWLRHEGHMLPGFRQPHGRGTRVLWSKRVLLAALTVDDAAVVAVPSRRS